jgi:hypothetical protein
MHALPRFIHEGSKPATRAGALTQGLECHFFFILTKRSLPVLESYWAEIFLDTGFFLLTEKITAIVPEPL